MGIDAGKGYSSLEDLDLPEVAETVESVDVEETKEVSEEDLPRREVNNLSPLHEVERIDSKIKLLKEQLEEGCTSTIIEKEILRLRGLRKEFLSSISV